MHQHPAPSNLTGTVTSDGTSTATGRGLRVDTEGRLSEVTITAGTLPDGLRAHVGVRGPNTAGGVGVEWLDAELDVGLDVDLVMWFDEHGAEHQAVNPVASVVAAAFGAPGQVFGPVVFTGRSPSGDRSGDPSGGQAVDVSAAAAVLLAGMATPCDPPLGPVSFDSLAWTTTADGDIARCVECGEPESHPEHQPEVLAAQADQCTTAQR